MKKQPHAILIVSVIVSLLCFCLDLSALTGRGSFDGGSNGETTDVFKNMEDHGSGSLEKEAGPASVKNKKFPWLLVATGAILAGVLVYFAFLHKPSYTVRVESGPGVKSGLTNGIHKYKKGHVLQYSFLPDAFGQELEVLLDGEKVPASGEIVVDRNHVLHAGIASTGEIVKLTVTKYEGISGEPKGGVYYYEKNFADKPGISVPYAYELKAGYSDLKVTVDGEEKPAAGTIVMDRDHTLEATCRYTVPPASWEEQLLGTWAIELNSMEGNPPVKITARFHFDSNNKRTVFFTFPNKDDDRGEWSIEDRFMTFNGWYDNVGGTSWQRLECSGEFAGSQEMSGSFEIWQGNDSPSYFRVDHGTWKTLYKID